MYVHNECLANKITQLFHSLNIELGQWDYWNGWDKSKNLRRHWSINQSFSSLNSIIYWLWDSIIATTIWNTFSTSIAITYKVMAKNSGNFLLSPLQNHLTDFNKIQHCGFTLKVLVRFSFCLYQSTVIPHFMRNSNQTTQIYLKMVQCAWH
jgi:hypothetical protein